MGVIDQRASFIWSPHRYFEDSARTLFKCVASWIWMNLRILETLIWPPPRWDKFAPCGILWKTVPAMQPASYLAGLNQFEEMRNNNNNNNNDNIYLVDCEWPQNVGHRKHAQWQLVKG